MFIYHKDYLWKGLLLIIGGIALVGIFFTNKQTADETLKIGEIPPDEVNTSDWKTWSRSDYGPECDTSPYCYDPVTYHLGITFKYPPYIRSVGYRDKGGGLWLYPERSSDEDTSIALDCTNLDHLESIDWLFPRSFEYFNYKLIEKRDVFIGGQKGIEGIFEAKGESPQLEGKYFKDRVLRFSVDSDKVCEIQASLDVDRDILEKIISTINTIH